MQFLLENRLNRCQFLGWFGFLKNGSRTKFRFSAHPYLLTNILANYGNYVHWSQVCMSLPHVTLVSTTVIYDDLRC